MAGLDPAIHLKIIRSKNMENCYDVSMSRDSLFRQIVAATVAPIFPALLLLFFSVIALKVEEGRWALQMNALVGYSAFLILGLPVHVLLQKTGRTKYWWYLVAGVLIGLIVDMVLWRAPPPFGWIVAASLVGAMCGIVFWAIARPDRTKPIATA